MNKIKLGKKLSYILIILYCLILSYLLIIDLSPSLYNIWTDNTGIISLSDSSIDFFSLWSDNLLGRFTYTISNNLLFILVSVFFHTFLNAAQSTYFIYLAINLFTLLTGYILAKSILKNTFKALLILPIFIYNPVYTYYLFSRGLVTLLIAFIGFNLFFYAIYNLFYSTQINYRYIYIAVIASIFLAHPFIFVFYFICAFYIFVINKKFKQFIIFSVGVAVLNLYWIAPFLSSYIYRSHSLLGSYTNELIFSFASTSHLQNSFVFLGRSVGFLDVLFGNMSYLWIVLFLSFWIFLVYFSFIKFNLTYLLFWPMLIFLLVFSLGPRTILGEPYRILFERFPAFSFFRSYQNVLVVLFCYAIFLALYIAKDIKKFLLYLTILSTLLLCTFLFFKDRTYTQKSVEIPNEYFQIKDIIVNDPIQGKIAVLPSSNHNKYVWDVGQDKNFLNSTFTQHGVIYLKPTNDFAEVKNIYTQLYTTGNFEQFSDYGVRYVIMRKDLLSDFTYYNNEIPLSKKYESPYVDLYAIEKHSPQIKGADLVFKRESPVKYKVQLRNVSKDFDLELLNLYNSGWIAYLESPAPKKLCENYVYEYDTAEGLIKECLYSDRISDLFFNPINRNQISSHSSSLLNTNVWNINYTELSSAPYATNTSTNNAGSLNFDITLYFIPQIFYILSLFFSLIILIALLISFKMNYVKFFE